METSNVSPAASTSKGFSMDPFSAAVLGTSVLSGLLQGGAQQAQGKAGLNLEQMLGQRGLDIQSAAIGDQIRRQLESMPVRDRVLAQLQARMGQAPGRFNPSGLFGNAAQPASTGGVDMGALQKAAQNYTPGAGGTRPDLASLMLSRLGYMPQGPQGQGTNSGNWGPGNLWQQSLNQGFGLNAPANWANESISTNTGNYQRGGPTTLGSGPTSSWQAAQPGGQVKPAVQPWGYGRVGG